MQDNTQVRQTARRSPSAVVNANDLPAGRSESSGQVLATRTGLRFPKDVTFDVWETAGRRISEVVDSFCWCIGDWLAYGQLRYPDRYRRAVDAIGLEYQTLRNYASVARRVGISRRRDGLSFQHHAEVAALPEAEQEDWLARAEQGGWSRNQLRQYLRQGRNNKVAESTVTRLPPVMVNTERFQRWRSAAAESGIEFEHWIMASLDRAAAMSALEEGRFA